MPRVGVSFFVVSFLSLFPSSVFSQPASSDPLEEVLTKMRSIEERVERIEAGEQEIFARDEKIQAKLKEVRVWASRRQRLVNQS